MKYTVNGFSQQDAIDIGLDNNDLLILRWLVDFANTKKMRREIIFGETYYWIKYSALIEDLPILKIKEDSLFRRLKKMSELEVLSHYTQQAKGKYSLYGFGPQFDRLIYERPIKQEEKHSEKNPSENNKKHSENIPSKKIQNTRKKIRNDPEKNPSETLGKKSGTNNQSIKLNPSINNPSICQEDSRTEETKFYCDFLIEKSNTLANACEDYHAIKSRFENLIEQVSFDGGTFNANNREFTCNDILKGLQEIFCRTETQQYDLLKETFYKIDTYFTTGQEIHNKYKYTVTILFNAARGL